jgi:fucose 4-O-acetylase-like acetyltransferase
LPQLDIAKGIAIVLLFYGHFIEHIYSHEPHPSVAGVFFLEWKLIYAFHMPLFFFVAGALAQSQGAAPFAVLKRRVVSYLYPYVTAGIVGLAVALCLVVATSEGTDELRSGVIHELLDFARRLFAGQGPGIGVTWFLACLAEVMILHHLLSRTAVSVPVRIVAFATLGGLTSMLLPTNVLNSRSLASCYALFLLGVVFFQHRAALENRKTLPLWLVGAGLVLLLSFDENTRPFSLRAPTALESSFGFAVLVSGGQIGNPVLFFLSAGAGIALVLALACLLQNLAWPRVLGAFGALSMEMFILNGFLWKFANGPVADLLVPAVGGDAQVALHATALAVTAVSLALCYGVATALRRGAPFMLRPAALPAFSSRPSR